MCHLYHLSQVLRHGLANIRLAGCRTSPLELGRSIVASRCSWCPARHLGGASLLQASWSLYAATFSSYAQMQPVLKASGTGKLDLDNRHQIKRAAPEAPGHQSRSWCPVRKGSAHVHQTQLWPANRKVSADRSGARDGRRSGPPGLLSGLWRPLAGAGSGGAGGEPPLPSTPPAGGSPRATAAPLWRASSEPSLDGATPQEAPLGSVSSRTSPRDPSLRRPWAPATPSNPPVHPFDPFTITTRKHTPNLQSCGFR